VPKPVAWRGVVWCGVVILVFMRGWKGGVLGVVVGGWGWDGMGWDGVSE
jgi:hypothetical protein